jgi:hypothetical protein
MRNAISMGADQHENAAGTRLHCGDVLGLSASPGANFGANLGAGVSMFRSR